MAKPSIEDVAKATGVSRSTVARVVSGAANVSDHTAHRVRAAIARLGYFGERAATAQEVFSFKSVGMVAGKCAIHDLTDVVGATLEVARRRGFNLVLLGPIEGETDFAKLREAVTEGALDALLVLPIVDPLWMAEIHALGCPVAELDYQSFKEKAASPPLDLHITVSEAVNRLRQN